MKVSVRASAAMVLIMALGFGLAGCTTKKVWRSVGQMCRAQGGTYNRETQQCHFTAATVVSGQQACQDLGGIYIAEQHRCEFDE